MPMSTPNDLAGTIVADEGFFKPQTMTNATYINGAEFERQDYESALAVFTLAFTSSSGASGGKVTVAIQAYDDTVTGMGTEATWGDAYSYEYTWAADGANSGVHCFPIDLRGANKFMRVKAKITKAGTITVAYEVGSLAVILGGMRKAPDDAYVLAGYESTTEAS